MTKTLTEQWKDGELPCGAYYVNRLGETRVYLVKYEDEKNTHEIYEVLAPVPSYDEFVQQREFVKDHQKLLIENMNLKLKIERLEKQLAKTKTKEYVVKVDWFSPDPVGFLSEKQTRKMFGDWKKKKEVK